MKRKLILVAALALAACNRTEPTAEQQPQDAFETQLRALNDSARNLAFRNAIRASDLRCERVDLSAFQGRVEGAGMWVAHCRDTGDFAIFVGKSGFAQIARCSDLPAGEVPGCRTLPLAGPAQKS